MLRKALIMKLISGNEEEYKRRHDEIWPELIEMLRSSGISDYSIFLHEPSSILFASFKLSEDNSADLLSQREVVKKWWDYMADIMETNEDHSPMEEQLKEVFYLA